MPFFPLFVDIKDKNCIFIGGGKVAARKIETLVEFGARIRVISPDAVETITKLNMENKLEYIKREYRDGDIEGAFLVFAATSDRDLNERVYQEAVRRNIFVNVADSPKECTFVFPSIISRHELVIGISTSGSYPALSKKIRMKIDEMLPQSTGDWFGVLKEYRKKAAEKIKDEEKRKRFLNELLDMVIDSQDNRSDIEYKIKGLFEVYKNEEEN